MYDAMTVDDLQEVYDRLGLSEGEIFTSVTIAGQTEPPPFLSKKDVDAAALAAQTLTAALGGINIAEAIKRLKKEQSPSASGE